MKTLFYTLIVLLISTSSFAQIEWEFKDSIPNVGMDQATAFGVSGNAYFGLGRQASSTTNKNIWEYNLVNDTLTLKTSYPGAGTVSCISFVVGDKAYVGMGQTGGSVYSDFYEYNPTNNTWTQKANFPGGNKLAAGSFTIGDTAYIVGGSCGGSTCYDDELWMYVPSTNTWTQRADFPGGNRAGLSAFSIGTFGYAGNGISSSRGLSNNFWKYNSKTNVWSTIASMPGSARRNCVAFSLNNQGYVGTGTFNWTPVVNQNDFYVYDPTTNSWTNKTSNSNFEPRHVAAVAKVNDSSVFVGTGIADYGRTNDIWQLKLNSNTASLNELNMLGFIVYPNPSHGQLNLKLNHPSNYTLKIYNTLGVEVFSQAVTASTYTINTSTIGVAGTYHLEVYDSLNAKRGRKTIIIQ